MRNKALLLFLFIAACTQAPQPFRKERTGFDPTSLRLRDGGTVMIHKIDGAQPALGKIITSSLAESLAARNIAATDNQVSNPSYVLRGVLVANRDDKTMDRGTLYWTFFDKTGQPIKESNQQIIASLAKWNFGDQALVDSLVDRTAEEFAAYLQDASEQEAVDQQTDDLVRFVMKGVRGAPGDGTTALSKAMDLTLRQFGAKVEKDLTAGAYQISAQVDVLEAFEGRQRIKIDWIVENDKGIELGRINQNNRVPEGSLNGKWGRLAYTISRAAISGIGEVVERDRLEQRWQRSRDTDGGTALPGQRSKGLLLPF